MTEIVNVKWSRHRSLLTEYSSIAYCGLSYDYWRKIYPAMDGMEDLSVLGKQRKFIVKGNVPRTMDNYRTWLWRTINAKAIAHALLRIGSGEFDAIACWCRPSMCHTEIILDAAKYLFNKESA